MGGDEADVGRYPYMVSLLNKNDKSFCGGSLIDSRWVLSAAHCEGRATHVLIGHHNFSDISVNSEKIRVHYEVVHPSFSDNTLDYDVMMIKLGKPSSFNVIKMNIGDTDLSEGTNVTTMGWGRTIHGGYRSDILLEVEVQTVSNGDCNEIYYNRVTDSMICAAAEGKDACQGDSGGPLIIKGSGGSTDVQIGIVSWGKGCADPRYPGVYARVEESYDFIKDTIDNSVGPECNFPIDSFNYTDCNAGVPCWIGDHECESDYNTTECNYDGGDCKWCPFPTNEFDYSNCKITYACYIGDGVCQSNLLSNACNYDGGDCKSECGFVNDGFDYSDCRIDTPCYIGNGVCDRGGYDSAECNYDGGDCWFPNDGFDYSNCDVLRPYYIGDGKCDDVTYSGVECNYDGGDCPVPIDESNNLFPDDGFDYSNCDIEYPHYIGDDTCDRFSNYNTPECNYDGGDCFSLINVLLSLLPCVV